MKAIGAGLDYGLCRLEFHHTNWTGISVYIDGVESKKWRFSLSKLDEKHWVCSSVSCFSFTFQNLRLKCVL